MPKPITYTALDADAKELFDKLLANVTGVKITWTSSTSFTIDDLQTGESKEYQIKEIK